MEFLTASYCESGGEGCALVLQHYAYKGVELVFACVVGDAPLCRYFAEKLLLGFRRCSLRFGLGSPEKYLKRAAGVLEKVIAETDREVSEALGNSCMQKCVWENSKKNVEEEIPVSGVLCVGEECLIFARGDMSILLLNRDMGKPCAMPLLRDEMDLRVGFGTVESGVGVLLATGDFLRGIGERKLKEGLFVEELLRPICLQGQGTELIRCGGKRIYRGRAVQKSEIEDRCRQEYMAEKHLRELGLAGQRKQLGELVENMLEDVTEAVQKKRAAILVLTKEAEGNK